ncbi:hypothetical protein BP00DRAFT_8898 [Aspergillus indologenus CBS 114.80]|uniref:Uncharacterized protein n=1 Tax=Aspergillus indologenus CBS 114.80 TaxID=1450541 RepID=A0A2V5ILP9_9EURO|nr:hypothetical protein BP00DRAFT_8898 [Aspergillus indologenus CBS 114.80]
MLFGENNQTNLLRICTRHCTAAISTVEGRAWCHNPSRDIFSSNLDLDRTDVVHKLPINSVQYPSKIPETSSQFHGEKRKPCRADPIPSFTVFMSTLRGDGKGEPGQVTVAALTAPRPTALGACRKEMQTSTRSNKAIASSSMHRTPRREEMECGMKLPRPCRLHCVLDR